MDVPAEGELNSIMMQNFNKSKLLNDKGHVHRKDWERFNYKPIIKMAPKPVLLEKLDCAPVKILATEVDLNPDKHFNNDDNYLTTQSQVKPICKPPVIKKAAASVPNPKFNLRTLKMFDSASILKNMQRVPVEKKSSFNKQ